MRTSEVKLLHVRVTIHDHQKWVVKPNWLEGAFICGSNFWLLSSWTSGLFHKYHGIVEKPHLPGETLLITRIIMISSTTWWGCWHHSVQLTSYIYYCPSWKWTCTRAPHCSVPGMRPRDRENPRYKHMESWDLPFEMCPPMLHAERRDHSISDLFASPLRRRAYGMPCTMT